MKKAPNGALIVESIGVEPTTSPMHRGALVN